MVDVTELVFYHLAMSLALFFSEARLVVARRIERQPNNLKVVDSNHVGYLDLVLFLSCPTFNLNYAVS